MSCARSASRQSPGAPSVAVHVQTLKTPRFTRRVSTHPALHMRTQPQHVHGLPACAAGSARVAAAASAPAPARTGTLLYAGPPGGALRAAARAAAFVCISSSTRPAFMRGSKLVLGRPSTAFGEAGAPGAVAAPGMPAPGMSWPVPGSDARLMRCANACRPRAGGASPGSRADAPPARRPAPAPACASEAGQSANGPRLVAAPEPAGCIAPKLLVNAGTEAAPPRAPASRGLPAALSRGAIPSPGPSAPAGPRGSAPSAASAASGVGGAVGVAGAGAAGAGAACAGACGALDALTRRSCSRRSTTSLALGRRSGSRSMHCRNRSTACCGHSPGTLRAAQGAALSALQPAGGAVCVRSPAAAAGSACAVRGSSAASAHAPWLLVGAVASLMLQPLDALCATADCALAKPHSLGG